MGESQTVTQTHDLSIKQDIIKPHIQANQTGGTEIMSLQHPIGRDRLTYLALNYDFALGRSDEQ